MDFVVRSVCVFAVAFRLPFEATCYQTAITCFAHPGRSGYMFYFRSFDLDEIDDDDEEEGPTSACWRGKCPKGPKYLSGGILSQIILVIPTIETLHSTMWVVVKIMVPCWVP